MMTWDKPITADGATATPEQLTEAWERWLRSSDMTASTLAAYLLKAGVIGTARHWPTARVADRMLQRARRAEVIRFERGRWIVIGGDLRADAPLEPLLEEARLDAPGSRDRCVSPSSSPRGGGSKERI